MSDELIDLAVIDRDAREWWVMRRDETLALVRLARADREWMNNDDPDRNLRALGDELGSALAAFNDSAESTS